MMRIIEQKKRRATLKFTPAETAKEAAYNAEVYGTDNGKADGETTETSPPSSTHKRFTVKDKRTLNVYTATAGSGIRRDTESADAVPNTGSEVFDIKDTMQRKSKYYRSHPTLNKLGSELSRGLTRFADSTDDSGVRAANQERRILRSGVKRGGQIKRDWLNNTDKHIDKRKSKRDAKEKLRQDKARLYMEKHGVLPQDEVNRRRRQQKRKLMQRQIRQLCEKDIGAKTVSYTFRKVGELISRVLPAGRWLVSTLVFSLLGIVCVVIVIMLTMFVFSSLFTTTVVTTLSSYTAEDEAIEAASMLTTELEAKLEQEIAGIPSQWKWGHIDEFRYNLDPIGHDPWQLMAYLSVVKPGFEFDWLSPVPGIIRDLHDTRYRLELDEERETRYRTEVFTDPTTGEEIEYETSYTYYILNVRLSCRSIEGVVYEQLQASPEGEQWEWYQLLMETGGSRQEFANPFPGVDWRGIFSSPYGYRIDPVGGKNLQIHRGLDIPMPTGTPIHAGLTGVVRYAGVDANFGNYIVIDDERGRTLHYAHCHRLFLRTGEPVTAGEVIAHVGSTGNSTGSHVHIEVKKNGVYLNPIFTINYEQ